MPAQQDPDGTSPTNGVSTDHQGTNGIDDGPRRSGRARRPVVRDQGDEDELATNTVTTSQPLQNGASLTTRRNPKRKAAVAAPVYNLPENLREASLAALSSGELQKWLGWVELESEPSFFNVILRELGVEDVKVQELFSVDEGSLAFLPKPVHGLIFLYQYVEEDREDDLPDCPDNVWFANQTTDNACATVALLNIVMNGKDIKLGEKLEEFKKATQDLSAPIRGHALSANSFIRTTHNSLARRLDLLNADLMLLNEYDDSKKKRARFTKGRKQKSVTEAAFHFIAYVPTADGKIWELDGLQSDPVCLGQYSDDWTAVVRPIIEARMLQYESDNMSFNLLALCRTPLDTLRQELVTNIRKLLTLEKRILEIPEMSSIAASERTWLNGDDETSLAEYGVSKEDLTTAAAPQSFKDKISKPSFETAEALDLQQSLEDEQKRIRSEYVAELAATDEDEARVLGRKKDYAPAIHEWVKKLAEHGVLQELINNV